MSLKLPLRSFLLVFPLVAASMAAGCSSSSPVHVAPDDGGAPSSGDDGGSQAALPPPPFDAGAPDVDAGPPHVDAAIASTDIVVIPSWDVALGSGYDDATSTLHGQCTTDPSPLFVGGGDASLGSIGIDQPSVLLAGAVGAQAGVSEHGLELVPDVAAWVDRAGWSDGRVTSWVANRVGDGDEQFSGSESLRVKSPECDGQIVTGIALGAVLVWGIDVKLIDGGATDAVRRAYGDDVLLWFQRPDAAWVGAALADKATITFRVLQVGGPATGLAQAVSATRCSFGAMDECEKTLDAIRAFDAGPFSDALATPPTAASRGGWSATRIHVGPSSQFP